MMKRVFPLVLAGVMAVGMAAAAFADEIGTVDYEKLIMSYNKAQSFNDDAKIREQEIQKMKAEFTKQLRDTKTAQPNNPVALEQLEKELQGKLDAKLNETRDWMATKSKELEKELNNAIGSVALAKKLDVVIAKQNVFHGGTDITNDVLVKLNSSK